MSEHKMTLYDHMLRLRALEDAVAANHGDLVYDSDLYHAWNDASGALIAKVDDFAEYLFSLDAESDAYDKMIERLKAKKAAAQAHKTRLLKFADSSIEANGGKSLDGSAFVIKRVKNPPSVRILDEEAVIESDPLCLLKTPLLERHEIKDGKVFLVRIDKGALKDDLKKNNHIRGAELVQGHRVEVR